MANKVAKTEHAGAKDSSAKSGFWGRRSEAKKGSKKLRRRNDKTIIAQRTKE